VFEGEFKGAVFDIVIGLNELADNILTLKQGLNSATAEIKSTSLVGCNLEDDNPTNNPDSQYGKQVLQKLYQGGVEGNLSVRSRYVAIRSDGTKVTSSTGTGDWIHKDSAAISTLLRPVKGFVYSITYDNYEPYQ
jgi:hypothetical protein